MYNLRKWKIIACSLLRFPFKVHSPQLLVLGKADPFDMLHGRRFIKSDQSNEIGNASQICRGGCINSRFQIPKRLNNALGNPNMIPIIMDPGSTGNRIK